MEARARQIAEEMTQRTVSDLDRRHATMAQEITDLRNDNAALHYKLGAARSDAENLKRRRLTKVALTFFVGGFLFVFYFGGFFFCLIVVFNSYVAICSALLFRKGLDEEKTEGERRKEQAAKRRREAMDKDWWAHDWKTWSRKGPDGGPDGGDGAGGAGGGVAAN